MHTDNNISGNPSSKQTDISPMKVEILEAKYIGNPLKNLNRQYHQDRFTIGNFIYW